jgi:hypothetical protein
MTDSVVAEIAEVVAIYLASSLFSMRSVDRTVPARALRTPSILG